MTLNVVKNVTNQMDMPENRPSWKAWFTTYGPRFLLFARQQTKSLADAEDVLQEAILRVWKYNKGRGNPSPSSVFQAIRHAALDLGRKDSRRKTREQKSLEFNAKEDHWFIRPLEEMERNRSLLEAMKQLPDEQREALILKIWGELTFEEIGKTLSISAHTAASRHRYALGALRKTLTPATL